MGVQAILDAELVGGTASHLPQCLPRHAVCLDTRSFLAVPMPFRFGASDSATLRQAEAMSFWWVFLRPLVGSFSAGSLSKRRYTYPEQR